MKFICVQPDSDYYLWQLQVLANNFKKFGIDKDAIFIVGYRNQINPKFLEFKEKTKATIEFIEDTRKEIVYVPSLRPHLLKKYFRENVIDEPVFYHDADIVFTNALPDFSQMTEKKLYVSDTISYIGANYIKSKSVDLFKHMCEIIGIPYLTVEENELNSGGAQYLFNFKLSYGFWHKVEICCDYMYKYLVETSDIYSPEHPIQAWTTDMWVVLWTTWLFGYESEIHKELDFCWPMHPIEDWDKTKIFHNAGVTDKNPEWFLKSHYIDKTPFNEKFENIDKTLCCYNYIKEIQDTKKKNKKYL